MSSNNVFFGTEKGLFYSNLQNFNTQKITLDSTIKSISNLSKIRNTIYAGTKSGIVFSLDLQKFNLGIIVNDFKYPIKDIIEDDKKNEELRLAQAEKNKKMFEENCQSAQANQKMLSNFKKVLMQDENGNEKLLTGEEITEQLEINKKHLDIYCEPSN